MAQGVCLHNIQVDTELNGLSTICNVTMYHSSCLECSRTCYWGSNRGNRSGLSVTEPGWSRPSIHSPARSSQVELWRW